MKKKARLVDIAKKLDISVASVSRALKGYNDISDSTKQKVYDMAYKLGYKVNKPVKWKRNIIIFFPFERNIGEVSATYNFISEIVKTVEKQGHNILLVPSSICDSYLNDLSIDCFIFTQVAQSEKHIAYCLEHNINFISLGYKELTSPYNSVSFDNKKWIEESLAEHLNSGINSPLMIVQDIKNIESIEKLAALRSVLRSKGIDFDITKHLFVWQDYSDDNHLNSYLNNRTETPDVLIFDSNLAMTSYHEYCRPETTVANICLIGDKSLIVNTNINCKYYFQDYAKAGKEAAKIMLDSFNNSNASAKVVKLATESI